MPRPGFEPGAFPLGGERSIQPELPGLRASVVRRSERHGDVHETCAPHRSRRRLGEPFAMSVGAPGLLAQEQRYERDFEAGVAHSPWQSFWRRLREDRVAMAALAVIVLLIFVAVLAPLVV